MAENIASDAENGIMGRVASFAAKQALLGKEVAVVNSEKSLVSGDRFVNIERRKELRRLNAINPSKGPFFSKLADKMMKRSIRGMIPDFRKGRGKQVFGMIRCYSGIPEELKNAKAIKIETKKMPPKVMTLGDLSRSL